MSLAVQDTDAPRPIAPTDLSARLAFDAETIAAARALIAPEAPDEILRLLLVRCAGLGVDPLAKMIYAVGRFDKRANKKVWALQVSIDCFRTLGNMETTYEGQDGPYWCGEDGVWKDVWLEPPGKLKAARIGIRKTGFAEPLYATALVSEYNAGGPMWDKMLATMIAKCAEALAWRRAFPQRLAGLYTGDEMAQADRNSTPSPRVIENAPPSARELVELHAQAGAPEETLGVYMRIACNDATIGEIDAATGKRRPATAEQMRDTKRMLEATIAARANAAAEDGDVIDGELVEADEEEAPPALAATPQQTTLTPEVESAQLAFAEATGSRTDEVPATKKQLAAIQATFRERFMGEPMRHAFAAMTLGSEDLCSSKTWTVAHAAKIMDALAAQKEA